MNSPKNTRHTADDVLRTMREMLLEASPEETLELAREAGLNPRSTAEAGGKLIRAALEQCKTEDQNQSIPMHKALNSLLVMLRRRDGLDESELAEKADVSEEEIRRIEFDVAYIPAPRTIFRLEKAFSLPSGVLVKLSGAVKHNSPEMEERVLEFAANAKSMGKLTKEERQLLSAFVKFLTEQS